MNEAPDRTDHDQLRLRRNAVFIGGAARSGTTMLGSILGSSPECIATPESQFKTDILERFGRVPDAAELPAVVDYIRGHFRFGLWNVQIPREPAWVEGHWDYGDLICGVVDLYARTAGRDRWRLWVDHTPRNRRYVSALFDIFPDARFIHLVRDGRAVAASLMRLDWGPNTIAHAAEFWLQSVASGMAAELRYPDRVIRVRYEDIVQDPEVTVRSLCERLGVTFGPEMLTRSQFRPPAYTQHQHELVGHRPDPNVANRWRRDLSERQVEIFESIAGEVLEALGYSRTCGLAARRPSFKEQLLAGELRMSVRTFTNLTRKGLRITAARWNRR